MLGALWLAGAQAAPVLEEAAGSAEERCVSAALGEIDLDLPPVAALTPGAALDRIAIVVGVPCHHGDAIPPLAYSARDAARMGRRLADAGYAVVTLTGLVDRAAFLDVLDRAEAALSRRGDLVVYFSGHGVLADHGDEVRRYLVFSDTGLSSVQQSGLSVRSLDARISAIKAHSRVVIQDTCFAASAGGKSLGLPGRTDLRAKGLPRPESVLEIAAGDARMYASQYFEQAVESPELRASVYTDHLLAALSGVDADLDGDGCVDLREGHVWARDHTSADRNGHQTPTATFPGPPDRLGCVPSAPSRGVLQVPDGDLWTVEVRDTAHGAVVQRGGGALTAGTYRVRVGQLEERPREPGQLYRRPLLDARVRVDAGEWLDLGPEVQIRRTPIWEITADAVARRRSELPAAGGGVTLLYSAPATPLGRPSAGARVQLTGGNPPSSGSPSRSVELVALLGHAWTRRAGSSRLAFGPLLGAGVAVVSRLPPCEAPLDCGITKASSLGQASLRGRWFVSDTVTLAAEVGVDAYLQQVADRFETRVVPTLRIGVGPRL